MASTQLSLHDGRLLEFQNAELASTLTRLHTLDQAYCLGENNVAHVKIGDNLLLVDVGFHVNRRLLETHLLAFDPQQPFSVRATSGSVHRSLEEALLASGWLGALSSLSSAHMAMYEGISTTSYLAPGQLVVSTGTFGGEAAVLKTIVAGGNVQMSEGPDRIILDVPLDFSRIDSKLTELEREILEKQDILSASPPLRIENNEISINLSSLPSSAQVSANASAIVALQEGKQDKLTPNATIAAGALPVNLEASRVRNLFGVEPLEVKLEPLFDNVSVGIKYLSPLVLRDGALSVDPGAVGPLVASAGNPATVVETENGTPLIQTFWLTDSSFTNISGELHVLNDIFCGQQSVLGLISFVESVLKRSRQPGVQTTYLEVGEGGLFVKKEENSLSNVRFLPDGSTSFPGPAEFLDGLVVDGVAFASKQDSIVSDPPEGYISLLEGSILKSVRFEGFDVLSNESRLMVSAEPITQTAGAALSKAENNEARIDDAVNRILALEVAPSVSSVHTLADTLVRFGAPVVCDFDLEVTGTLTASAIFGGAAVQISNNIASAISGKQDKITADAPEGYTSLLEGNILKSVAFESLEVQVGPDRLVVSAEPVSRVAETALLKAENNEARIDDAVNRIDSKQAAFDVGDGLRFESVSPGSPLRLRALSPFHICGQIRGDGTVVFSKGRSGFSSSRVEQGGYEILFDQPHPDGSNYVATFSTIADPRIGPLTPSPQNGTVSSTGFKLISEYANQSGSDYSAQWDAPFVNILVV